MTQKKQHKIDSTRHAVDMSNSATYSMDMFRNEHPCKLPDKKWKEQMIMLYPELKANWMRHK